MTRRSTQDPPWHTHRHAIEWGFGVWRVYSCCLPILCVQCGLLACIPLNSAWILVRGGVVCLSYRREQSSVPYPQLCRLSTSEAASRISHVISVRRCARAWQRPTPSAKLHSYARCAVSSRLVVSLVQVHRELKHAARRARALRAPVCAARRVCVSRVVVRSDLR